MQPSTAALSVELPGVAQNLWIDFTTHLAVFQTPLSASVTVALPIPDDAALIGADLYAQGLHPYPGPGLPLVGTDGLQVHIY